jgi:hypothetical protein
MPVEAIYENTHPVRFPTGLV